MKEYIRELQTAIKTTLLLLVLTCAIFPGLIWTLAQLFLTEQANGSLVRDKSGNIVGSSLIGQNFSSPKYFHPRPSAAGSGYDAANSSGTNLGPISRKLIEGSDDDPATLEVDESFAGFNDLARRYRRENMLEPSVPLPADSITRSASGLDPHISPRNALLQAPRVAHVRGLSVDYVEKLVARHTEDRFLGLFGERRVNVLKLNLELDILSRDSGKSARVSLLSSTFGADSELDAIYKTYAPRHSAHRGNKEAIAHARFCD